LADFANILSGQGLSAFIPERSLHPYLKNLLSRRDAETETPFGRGPGIPTVLTSPRARSMAGIRMTVGFPGTSAANFSARQTLVWCSQSRATSSPAKIPVDREVFREFEREFEPFLEPEVAKVRCGAIFLRLLPSATESEQGSIRRRPGKLRYATGCPAWESRFVKGCYATRGTHTSNPQPIVTAWPGTTRPHRRLRRCWHWRTTTLRHWRQP